MTHYKAKIIITVISAISVLICGMILTWYQVISLEQRRSMQTAYKTLNSVETLLDEAKNTADQASVLLSEPCSMQVRTKLERIVISARHIRLIAFYKGRKIYCSSFSDMDAINKSYAGFINSSLAIVKNNTVSPGIDAIVLQTQYPQGIIVTSLSTAWISEIMHFFNAQHHMDLLIDNDIKSSGASLLETGYVIIKSKKYPIAVSFYSAFNIFSYKFITDGWVSLLLSAILSIIVGVLLWRYILHSPSLYENLSKAIDRGEIIPWYQPIVHSNSYGTYGVEVLARWISPSGEVISPENFIPLAEQSGLIIPLTKKLMAQVGKELPEKLEGQLQPFHVGFNFITAHLQEPEFLDECRAFIKKFPPGTIRLTAEILEREPFERVSQLKETLRQLQENHIDIALDDFGTGHSNLNYLSALPIDIIKIDKLFINGLSPDSGSQKIIDYVIEMAKTLNIKVVVEGVETQFQVEYLKKKRVDYFQGYYFSKPVPINKLTLR
ncbi:EAL domain-containing protein [Enterobacillus tribolii]|uniref:cyclic-guanylate-specific phosphodiesterase n=1 Tax=Enterobacillus tribolii TaxID=1487935 RepID=A0A370QQI5_9GAMM|nr:EAL domain-containing protein [Enterobacillus tribolii]MBW7981587.1 EAL domain-containing protein [Enterobacillus tribolii]RDK90965.1 sensor c-di-GMP phosphodiesterase-like protein [Enterobacillus tribolii]